MKYEHKTVGLSWFDAHDRREGDSVRSGKSNLGCDRYCTEDENAGWHVVGTIPGSGDPNSKTFFLMERVVGDGERET